MKRGLRRYDRRSPEPESDEEASREGRGSTHNFDQTTQLDERRLKVLVDLGYPAEYVLHVL